MMGVLGSGGEREVLVNFSLVKKSTGSPFPTSERQNEALPPRNEHNDDDRNIQSPPL